MKHSQEFEDLVAQIKPNIKEVTIEQVVNFQKEAKDFLLIDVREDHEWQQGHAPGAVHLGRGIIERDIIALEPNKGREIVLYCGGGYRSAMSAENLQKMGYTNIFSMAGGMRGWRELNLPEEKP